MTVLLVGWGRSRSLYSISSAIVSSPLPAGPSRNATICKDLAPTQIIDARTFSGAGVPLDKERWAGAVESAGSRTLENEKLLGR